ncbi:type A2 lantipeptide [Bacillus wiedmannii]|uniref:Lantibiotic n=2 Tax=Bacillus wiedmannii TaxID=1890302 RepID=A0A2C4TLD0_9BACI|nr:MULTISPECIES: type A2 lanthipeptide [Bacillus cereus group]KPU50914.1 lantibiotic salivaricin-A [Bacillus wiedmannii]MDA1834478.1 type A2 lanthipeptide [Bacillus cereus group sp. BY142LC]PEA78212.1 type A2 lantipeptide [Bacillus wiedmannii]PEG09017.1 type A2 lantipeptide [Bacillus wiedmannii]PEI74663.1 type A2 lantipeptide [Bacillus wiedmannii]
MEELKGVVMTVTDEELQEAAGAAGCGWLCTVTDDCPNSVFVCC